jgi:hypothetical protein
LANSSFDRRLANKILLLLFLFSGVTNLWLWYVGHANIVAAVLGSGLLVGSAVLAWQVYGKRG